MRAGRRKRFGGERQGVGSCQKNTVIRRSEHPEPRNRGYPPRSFGTVPDQRHGLGIGYRADVERRRITSFFCQLSASCGRFHHEPTPARPPFYRCAAVGVPLAPPPASGGSKWAGLRAGDLPQRLCAVVGETFRVGARDYNGTLRLFDALVQEVHLP